MARYVITTIAIVTIIFAAADHVNAAPPTAEIVSPASPVEAGLSEGREFTVLTYNTHLFEDSILECICRCGEVRSECTWADYNYDDGGRRTQIVNRIRASGADIVALEEVWALWWQRWFLEDLQDTYPYTSQYTATFDSSCPCEGALGGLLNTCLDLYICGFPFYYCCKGPFYPGTVAKKNTLGNGLVLLSKFPLSDVNFMRFPVFEQCSVGKCEAWSDKGVLTATVNVSGAPIRIGISHALTGPDDYNSKWDTDYVGTAITTFQLNGEAYIFALKKNGQGHIRHFEDYSYFDETTQTQKYGAGWKHLYADTWGADYVSVVSFELDGHPYLFGLDKSGRARITRINDDPSTGWTYMYGGDWGSDYVAVTSFEMDVHPYIFGLDANEQAHITRINNNPATGWERIYGGAWGSGYDVVTSFELDGHPYLFTIHRSDETARIYRINNDPCTGWKGIYEDGYPHEVNLVSSFELQGHPYLFTCSNIYDVNGHIFRINNDPCIGWEHIGEGNWYTDSMAVKSFEMNGHPYLFTLRNCCDQSLDSPLCRPRPGEAYLKRVNDDGKGWENLYQLEDMKIIRDATVVENGPPAIMMGDFNIHANKYGIMDELFRKAGAVDAYIEVHGTGDGGETIDLHNNKLAPKFCKDDPETPNINECDTSDPNVYPTEMSIDRIDYVYVKQWGDGLRLVPTDSYVIRNWKYGADNMDLSDHYPLLAKFRLETGCNIKGDFDCDGFVNLADLAILCSAWLSEPGSGIWDRACDISNPGDDFIDMKDFEEFARQWRTIAVHNVTQDKGYGLIQAAINDANDGDEIEASPGTYYEAINFKGKAIRLYSSGGHDVTTIDGSGAYHVVQCVSGEDANTTLEGFTINGGNATGVGEAGYGGGMYNKDSSPSVTNCIFRGNKAVYGGGMLNSGSSPIMTNCTFSGNSASTDGGGMLNNGSSPIMTNCTFSGNTAVNDGGGMRNYSSSPTVTNCTFSNNKADAGGAIINEYYSHLTAINCTFTNNKAIGNGGGILNRDHGYQTVTNCIFTNNSAIWGGGIYNLTNSNATVTNCTFTGNSASTTGGGMMNNVSSTSAVTNCIFWANTPNQIFNYDGHSPATVTYSDVKGGFGGTGNINADPLFVDAIGGNLRLSSGSPCIDKGSNAAVPSGITTDLDGNPRVSDGDSNGTVIVDMGAYEYLITTGNSFERNLEAYCVLASHWLEVP